MGGSTSAAAGRERMDGSIASAARLRLLTALVGVALLGAALLAPAAGAGVHKGNYTCYQAGSLYWGYFEVKGKNKYEIAGGKGKFKLKKGTKLVFKSGSLKKWGWKGKYSTGRSLGGEREWQIDLIDKKNGIKINCYDG